VTVVRAGAATDVGRLRTENQDSFFAGRQLWLVADGMGGQAAGGLASRLAAAELAGLDEEPQLSDRAIELGLQRANQRLLDEGRSHLEHWGLGTTATGVARTGRQLAIFNVGDSRVYRFADGKLVQLTTDHSAVQEAVDAGLLDPVSALHHPRRNIVTRSLGTRPPPVPDIWLRAARAGERYLICSDGLTNELSDAEIAAVLRAQPEPQAAADQLVAAAVDAGGRDNVTVLVLLIEADPGQH